MIEDQSQNSLADGFGEKVKGPRLGRAVQVFSRAVSSIFVVGDMFGQYAGNPVMDTSAVPENEEKVDDEEKEEVSAPIVEPSYLKRLASVPLQKRLLQAQNATKRAQDSLRASVSSIQFKKDKSILPGGAEKAADKGNPGATAPAAFYLRKLAALPMQRQLFQANNGTKKRRITLQTVVSSRQELNNTERLHDYMTLPVDTYSVLDSSMISRLNDTAFRLTLPLDQLINVNIIPEIDASVVLDPQQRAVTVSSQDCKIWTGSGQERHILPEELFYASFVLMLTWGNRKDLDEKHSRRREFRSFREKEKYVPAYLQSIESEQLGFVAGSLSVYLSFDAPSAISVFPLPLLKKSGAVVLDAVVGFLFPKFLNLLVQDYYRYNKEELMRQSEN